jgi:hypothetical protein
VEITPTQQHFKIGSSRLIRCGVAVCWSINRVILVLTVRGVGRFTQPMVIQTISMHMISAQTVCELLEYGSELPDIC